ncbi:haloacid dehalogenase type II [Pandoraea sputorum]|uniref:(S)-2-haloacid dehalogenase n=1 Tax=Pandoraea sputorum TaxID=93222 RepID=A0A239SEZ6_9BURK|nr:haloacid dehalogenase type II [Pandoraea sputorum]AJC16535.1 haloacid dehalogenase, type II [Pandoraea sputorum]SNU83468.1 (S)-2-haloacid dehalogenase [Pandoraea sputorum]VVD98182.1 haloacid dehalogenase, type II [Pandoraea sputorum]
MTSDTARRFAEKTILTIDVYGTLIDWESGIFNALDPILRSHGHVLTSDALLEKHAWHESALEAGPYLTYREILEEALRRIARDLEFTPTEQELESFSHSVGDWPAFSDSTDALLALQQRFQLAVITNGDDEFFALSNKHIGVEFDYVVTAEQTRSYKPSLNNFHVALGRMRKPRSEVLHVAQSLFHDHVPAQAVGLQTVWINRRQGRPGYGAVPRAVAVPDAEFADLRSFADAILDE